MDGPYSIAIQEAWRDPFSLERVQRLRNKKMTEENKDGGAREFPQLKF